jgi:ferredoxin
MKIIIEKAKCIGCGSCQAVCADFFELRDDGKSHLKGGTFNNEKDMEELEIKEAGCAKEAMEICPVQCIKLSP